MSLVGRVAFRAIRWARAHSAVMVERAALGGPFELNSIRLKKF